MACCPSEGFVSGVRGIHGASEATLFFVRPMYLQKGLLWRVYCSTVLEIRPPEPFKPCATLGRIHLASTDLLQQRVGWEIALIMFLCTRQKQHPSVRRPGSEEASVLLAPNCHLPGVKGLKEAQTQPLNSLIPALIPNPLNPDTLNPNSTLNQKSLYPPFRKDVNESLMWPLVSKLVVTFQTLTRSPKPKQP